MIEKQKFGNNTELWKNPPSLDLSEISSDAHLGDSTENGSENPDGLIHLPAHQNVNLIGLDEEQNPRQVFLAGENFEIALDKLLHFLRDSLVAKHWAQLGKPKMRAALVIDEGIGMDFFPPALSARGFDLESLFFISTAHAERTISTVCSEQFFEAVLCFTVANPRKILPHARRFLAKSLDGKCLKGDELEKIRSFKLFVCVSV